MPGQEVARSADVDARGKRERQQLVKFAIGMMDAPSGVVDAGRKQFFPDVSDDDWSWALGRAGELKHTLVQNRRYADFREEDHPRDKSGQFTAAASNEDPMSVEVSGDLKGAATDITGSDLSGADLAKICGVPEGGRVKVEAAISETGSGDLKRTNSRITVGGFADGFESRVSIEKMGFMKRATFEFMSVSKDKSGQGVGAKAFAAQASKMRDLGFDKIHANAVRDDNADNPAVGYWVWPKLGFDGLIIRKFPDLNVVNQGISEDLALRAFAEFEGDSSKSDKFSELNISDLMRSERGRKWWKENGQDVEVEFDLRDGSQSRKVFDEYMRRKFGE